MLSKVGRKVQRMGIGMVGKLVGKLEDWHRKKDGVTQH